MTPDELRLLVAALGAAVALAVLVAAVNRPLARGGGEEYLRGEDGTVECPACGAENDLGFRYCRACVDDLPGAPSTAGDGQDGPRTAR